MYGYPKAYVDFSLLHSASFGSAGGLPSMESVPHRNSYSMETASGNQSSRRAREY